MRPGYSSGGFPSCIANLSSQLQPTTSPTCVLTERRGLVVPDLNLRIPWNRLDRSPDDLVSTLRLYNPRLANNLIIIACLRMCPASADSVQPLDILP